MLGANTRARLNRKGRNRLRGAKGKGNRKSRIPRSIVPKLQTARISETIEYSSLLANQSYASVFTLAQFNRAYQLAPYFKFYRPTRVEWAYEPMYNTFQESTTGATVSIPYFYTRMNRTQENHNYGKFDLQAMGAKPRKFVKIIKVAYKPNWCSPGLISVGQGTVAGNLVNVNTIAVQGTRTNYGWLSSPIVANVANYNQSIYPADMPVPAPLVTAGATVSTGAEMIGDYASTVNYNGHTVFIEQEGASATTQVCRITVTVHWEFKDPNNTSNLSAPMGVMTRLKPTTDTA